MSTTEHLGLKILSTILNDDPRTDTSIFRAAPLWQRRMLELRRGLERQRERRVSRMFAEAIVDRLRADAREPRPPDGVLQVNRRRVTRRPWTPPIRSPPSGTFAKSS